jgi:hypothetical protein
MARSTAAPQPTADALSADHPEVRRIAQLLAKTPPTLRDYFHVGAAMQRLAADRAVRRRGSKWRTRVAELLDCSLSTLTKSMHFHRSYEESELSRLEGLGVNWSRLNIALAIQDTEERHRLLKKAKDEGWSERDLQRAIQGQRGIRRKGGRPRREAMSQGVVGDLSELLRLARPWVDFHEQVWAPGVEGYLASLGELTPDARETLREMLRQAAKQLKELEKRAREVQAWLKNLDLPRSTEEEI